MLLLWTLNMIISKQMSVFFICLFVSESHVKIISKFLERESVCLLNSKLLNSCSKTFLLSTSKHL